ncbi:hypothetical protein SPJ1_0687 [Streptococcus parauberis KRS-02083]|uniref:Uncharacterized protein n=1 Tax=Streptococcus parauberis KRS-02083 TaxID=1207545 RepID=A0ABN0IT94_9STRE|nr:hypothetical protein SPJ1_0687 [Streptococcus parauberis KRS-02083]
MYIGNHQQYDNNRIKAIYPIKSQIQTFIFVFLIIQPR